MFWDNDKKTGKDLMNKVASLLLPRNFPPALEKKPIEIILVLTNTGATDQDAKTVSRISEIALEHAATCLNLTSTLAVFSYGMVEPIEPAGSQRLDLLKHLTSEFGKTVAVVHGTALARVGLVGSEKHVMSFSFLAPNFREALALVSTVPLGSVVEFDFGHCN